MCQDAAARVQSPGSNKKKAELSTNLVEVAVEPGNSVVHQVPDEALEVKEQEADQHLNQQPGESRGLCGQVDRSQVPVHHGEREDEDQVVVECQSQTAPHRGPADGALRLQLVPAHQGPLVGQHIQQQEGQAEEQVNRKGEEHGEERGQEEGGVLQEEGPERLQQHLTVLNLEFELCSAEFHHQLLFVFLLSPVASPKLLPQVLIWTVGKTKIDKERKQVLTQVECHMAAGFPSYFSFADGNFYRNQTHAFTTHPYYRHKYALTG